MIDDIEIIEDIKKEKTFNNKEYFTLAVIMIIITILQLLFSYVNICNEYLNTITIFKLGNTLYLIGNVILLIAGIVIITNLTQQPKLAAISGIIIGLVGFFVLPVISEIIGLLLFIDGIRLIINN